MHTYNSIAMNPSLSFSNTNSCFLCSFCSGTWAMKIISSEASQVSVFDDGVTTKDVITTLMQNNNCEVN